MKKSLSLLVAIAMVFSMFATLVSANEKSAGQTLQDLGVINGTSNGLDEDKEWLRQDVTVLIARLLGSEEAAKATANTHGFEDLDSKFYNGFVSWAKEKGYFNGESATKFGVGNPITNQQFAAVLLRVLNVEVDYAEAFDKAVELGLVSKDLDKAANAIRGDIYSSLVTALDYKIDGKKLGTILGLKGYEITDVAVTKATATNSKTVVVEFNQEIGDVLASNFSVTEKDSDAVEVISSVSQADGKVTVKLVDSLSKNKTYVVTASGVASKDASVALGDQASAEFSYVETTPATVSIPTTTVAYDDKIGIVIKDANGNDITDDIDLSDVDVVKVATSAENIVDVDGDNNLVAKKAEGYAVVNVQVVVDEETTLETGNIVIKVQPSVAVATNVSELTLGVIGEDAVLSLFKSDEGKSFTAKVVDKDNNVITPDEVSYKSANPTVLVVDATLGDVIPVKAGSATVTYTAKFNGKTVSKSVTVTVKEDAKFSTVELNKTSAKLVYGLDPAIAEKIEVKMKDQYGDDYTVTADDEVKVSIKASKDDILVGLGKVAQETEVFTGNKIELPLEVLATVDAATSTTVTVKVGSITKTISVSVVKAGSLAGYVAEIDNTKIDLNTASKDDDSNALKEKQAKVSVYAKDTNGNKIADVVAFDLASEDGKDFIDVAGDTITPAKVGTEKVTASVNGIKVGTFTVTVVDTSKALTKVVQNKNAITVKNDEDVKQVLFGTDDNGGAFVGYDQYGKKITFTGAEIYVYSADTTIVDAGGVATDKDGTVLLTVVIEGKTYTITVKVA